MSRKKPKRRPKKSRKLYVENLPLFPDHLLMVPPEDHDWDALYYDLFGEKEVRCLSTE